MTTQLPRSPRNSSQFSTNGSSNSASQPPSMDMLLDQIAQATSLQQSGKISEAAQLFKEISEADPDGQLGDVARKSLQSLGVAVAPAEIPDEDEPEYVIEPDAVPRPQERQFAQWFYNLPLRNKQLLGLFTSEVLSIVGLVGVGSVLIVNGLRGQLLQQAQSELAVTGINYNIKINQMGFGFRGQSDNAAIIESAQTGTPSALTFQILRNEITARNIEYATLVDRQARIIASANANRRGEVFDPAGLVTQVFANPEQIKTTEIVTWEELQKENPPLPEGFANQDALIRYTVTPVRNPQTQEVIGALISGDIVNGKSAIAQGTLDAFDGGYSAVYVHQDDGTFTLATSLYEADNTVLSGIELPTTDLLDRAVDAGGEIVTTRKSIESEPFSLAARAIPDVSGQPTAILVRGTPEEGINQVLRGSFTTQFILTFLVIAADIVLAILLTRSVARPIQKLQQSATKLAEGDMKARAEILATDEIGQLAQSFNQMAQNISAKNQEAESIAELRQREATFQREEKERLQRRVIDLLLEIEGAREGDLTVQAQVTDDEMGSVADAFNATVQSLRELVLQVQAVAEQVNLSATQSESSVGQLSESALNQAQTITQTLHSVEAMAHSIQNVASSAMEAAKIAREASGAAAEGGAAMQLTVESIEDLRGTVAETSKKVKRRTESSQEISKIVALISEVSAKTNLLAFNASIEAVRAGEHGQGFRIVADEVRRLAERVTESTKEIEQLVTGIQLETADVLTMMEKGTTQVVTGSQLVANTRQTLESLVGVSQKIDDLVQSISENTSSQNQVSQEVSETIKEVAAIATQSSSQSQEVSTTLKQLVAVAEDLRNSISQFRIRES
ncbi:MAG: methyl-accepting chemotaxis protein [Leptolyngbyaceae bacterium]|nr:methyl-accepting chemotaxis protein [Leptolyngbyaceae bacterium]